MNIANVSFGWMALASLGLVSACARAELRVNCPFDSAQTGIIAQVPAGWSQTPALGALVETRVTRASGEPVLVCAYEAGNTLNRPLPAGIRDCQVAPGGFVCEPSVGAAAPSTAAPSTADACRDGIQGRVAWNDSGNTKWHEANVERLCRGTTAPAEPGRCIERVLHGQISSGESTRWEWRHALDLCEGTNDADQTIRCFEEQIAKGESRARAIGVCD